MNEETVNLINAAGSAIRKLEAKRTYSSKKQTIIKGVIGDVLGALKRGVSYKAISDAISEATGEKVSGTTLKKYVTDYNLEIETKTQNIAAAIKGVKR